MASQATTLWKSLTSSARSFQDISHPHFSAILPSTIFSICATNATIFYLSSPAPLPLSPFTVMLHLNTFVQECKLSVIFRTLWILYKKYYWNCNVYSDSLFLGKMEYLSDCRRNSTYQYHWITLSIIWKYGNFVILVIFIRFSVGLYRG